MTQTSPTNSYTFREKYGLPLIFRRAAAYLLDILILFTILAPLGFLIQWVFGMSLPQTGPEVGQTILWNFSLPAWLYFILSDRSAQGATLGKRLLKVQVVRVGGQPITMGRALLRTAVKLLPWELVHISTFALSVDLTQLSNLQTVGLILANVLTFLYFVLFIATKGQRSVHDLAAQTEVRVTK